MTLEDEAHLTRLGIATLWHRLPAGAKAKARMQLGALAEGPAPTLAAAAWEMAKRGEGVPGCAPF